MCNNLFVTWLWLTAVHKSNYFIKSPPTFPKVKRTEPDNVN